VKTIASIDQNMRHDQIDLLFCKLDTDHSGKVSVKEFQKFFHDCYVMTEFKKHLVEFAQKNGQSIQHIFYNMSVADTMSKDEFTSLVQKITGNQFKLSEIDHLILKLDVDRNGFISKTELAEIYDLTQRQLYNLPDFISFRNAAIDYCKQLGLSLAQLYGEFAEGGKLGLEGLKKMAKKVMSEKADVLLIKGVLDKNFDTSIELSEFKEAIIGLDLKPEEILASIRRQVKSMRMTIDDLMNKFDRDQSQDLDYK
jgi:Ca2+-binding EF-hand superfamily protein